MIDKTKETLRSTDPLKMDQSQNIKQNSLNVQKQTLEWNCKEKLSSPTSLALAVSKLDPINSKLSRILYSWNEILVLCSLYLKVAESYNKKHMINFYNNHKPKMRFWIKDALISFELVVPRDSTRLNILITS